MVTPRDFERLRSALYGLNLEQAQQLYIELEALIQELQQVPLPQDVKKEGRDIIDVQRVGTYLYQFERVRCGKAGCKCAGEQGELHGPYWYAYWRDQGKLKSRYIGKRFKPIP